jgi:hypothetical protein
MQSSMSARGHSVFRLSIAAAVSFGAMCGAVAQSKDGDVNAYIAAAPIAGLPEGTFSQWTEAQKKTAVSRIGGFCQFLCVDAYSNVTFPNVAAAERAKADVKLCLSACIVNHLPKDYPDLEGLKQDLRANYDKAKQLGSAAPWPLPRK